MVCAHNRQTILQPKLRTPEEMAFPESHFEEIDGIRVRVVIDFLTDWLICHTLTDPHLNLSIRGQMMDLPEVSTMETIPGGRSRKREQEREWRNKRSELEDDKRNETRNTVKRI